MDPYKEIIKKDIIQLRQQYDFGNYWGRSLFDFVEKLKLESDRDILLFRLPFNISNISGFVGYKNDQFVVFTNTNKNLGHEIFTLAHEIYHLLENENKIREKVIINESENVCDYNDNIADKFAEELLLPENKLKEEYKRLLNEDDLTLPDEKIIIQLQQLFYVKYKVVTKRIADLGFIDIDRKEEIDQILGENDSLLKLTQKLGYNNKLNKPSKKVELPKKFLKAIEENYKNKKITYDDLVVIFGYGNLKPEFFGYEKENSLSDDTNEFISQIDKELGSGNDGKE